MAIFYVGGKLAGNPSVNIKIPINSISWYYSWRRVPESNRCPRICNSLHTT